MQLLRVEQKVESGKPVIYLFKRDSQGKRIIEKDDSLVPHFFIPDPQGTFTAFDGTKAHKIETVLPEEVRDLREKYERTFEADVHFTNRYIIDKVDSFDYVKPKVFYLDLECDNAGKMPSAQEAKFPIVCLGVYDNFSDVYSSFVFRPDLVEGQNTSLFDDRLHEINYFKTEESMLATFVKFFRESEPDVVTGWNLVSFDMVYLLSRMINLGINISVLSPINQSYVKGVETVIKGVAQIDLMRAYRKLSENLEESYTLDYIARKNVGEGKIEDSSQIRQLWKNDLDKLISYNIQDVKLTKLIDEKLKLLDFLDEIRRSCFCQLEDTLTNTRLLDSYILHLFHGKMVFPTKFKKEDHEAFEGGFVETWAKGIYENVAVFDLKSLYPSILVSENLSPETMDNCSANFIEIDGIKIDQSKPGFLPEVIRNLWVERAKYKDLMKKVLIDSDEYNLYDNRQKTRKIMLNAVYGQTGYPGSRFYDVRITKTTTYTGRKINEWSRNFLKKKGYNTLYADTDSVFVPLKKNDTIETMKILNIELNKSYDEFASQFGIKQHNFEVEFQKVYRKMFFGTAKKRYAGHLIWKEGQEVSKIDSIGFETRRSDATHLTKNMQNKIFEMILKEDKTKDEVMRYIGGLIDKVRKGDYKLIDIGIPKGISKDLSDYGNKMLLDNSGNVTHTSSVPVNIRAARYSEQVLNFQLSSKPKMIYISALPAGLPTIFEGKPVDAICFDYEYQIPSGVVVDIETMLDKLIKMKLEAVFSALNWPMSELSTHWKGKVAKSGNQPLLLEIQDYGSKGKFTD